jgi:hypothetical protein
MANNQEKYSFDSTSPKVENQNYPSPNSGGGFFEIRIKGHLNNKWSEWFEGMELKLLVNGEMILFGPIEDQAALMGILNKLSRLNLTLLSVNEVEGKINK